MNACATSNRRLLACALAVVAGLVAPLGCSSPAPRPPSIPPRELTAALERLDEKVGDPATTSAAVRRAALEDLERVLRSQPHSLRARKRRAELFALWGPPAAALADLDRLEEDYGRTAELTALRGVALYTAKRRDEAHAAFRAVLAQDRRNTVSLLYLGLLLAEEGEFDAAAKYFARVAAIDPTNASAKNFLTMARAASGEPGAGAAEAAEAADPSDLKRAGLVLLRAGKVRRATESLLRALRAVPGDTEILRALARGFSSRGMHRTAAEILAHVVELEPRDPEARFAYGTACAGAGAADETYLLEAARSYEACVDLASDPRSAHLGAARMYAHLGDLEKALAHFEAALRGGTAPPEAFLDYGVFLARHCDLEAAARMFERGLSEHGGHADLVANLMAVSFENGQLRAAHALRRRLEAKRALPPGARSLLAIYGGAP